jgi:hypothetical protein
VISDDLYAMLCCTAKDSHKRKSAIFPFSSQSCRVNAIPAVGMVGQDGEYLGFPISTFGLRYTGLLSALLEKLHVQRSGIRGIRCGYRKHTNLNSSEIA